MDSSSDAGRLRKRIEVEEKQLRRAYGPLSGEDWAVLLGSRAQRGKMPLDELCLRIECSLPNFRKDDTSFMGVIYYEGLDSGVLVTLRIETHGAKIVYRVERGPWEYTAKQYESSE